MDLLEFLRLVFIILFRGLRLLANIYGRYHSTFVVMRMTLTELLVRMKILCLLSLQVVQTFNHFKKGSSTKTLSEFWELVISPLKLKVKALQTAEYIIPSWGNIALCYVAKSANSVDKDRVKSAEENREGVDQPEDSLMKGLTSPPNETKVSSTIPPKRKGLLADVVAKRRRSTEELQTADPSQYLPTDSKTESQEVEAPTLDFSLPLFSSFGSPASKKLAWTHEPPDSTDNPTDKLCLKQPSSKTVDSNQDIRPVKDSISQSNIDNPEDGSGLTPEKASKILKKKTALYRPYSLGNEKKDTPQNQSQNATRETLQTDEGVIYKPGDNENGDDSRNILQKRNCNNTQYDTPVSDIEESDSAKSEEKESHPNVTALLRRRKNNIFSMSIYDVSSDSCFRTTIPTQPLAFEGLGGRMVDFVHGSRIFADSGQSPNCTSTGGLASQTVSLVSSTVMLEESVHNLIPFEGLERGMVDAIDARMFGESFQSSNPMAFDDLGSRIVDSTEMLDQIPNPIASEEFENQIAGFLANDIELDRFGQFPMNYIPEDETNRDLQRALLESFMEHANQREPEEFFPWAKPKHDKNPFEAFAVNVNMNRTSANQIISKVTVSETVPNTEVATNNQEPGKSSEVPYKPHNYKSYPGIAEQPLKVKKDARYQKKFYKKKPVTMPRKIGKALREGAFRESHQDALDEFVIRNMKEDSEEKYQKMQREAYMRRYVYHVMDEVNFNGCPSSDQSDLLSPDANQQIQRSEIIMRSFPEGSPSSSSQKSSDCESDEPKWPKKNPREEDWSLRIVVKFTMDFELLQKVRVKFAEPTSYGEDIIFSRDLSYRKREERDTDERIPIMPLLKIVEKSKSFRIPSVEEFLVSLDRLQGIYWEKYRSPCSSFYTFEECIELYTTPIMRESSVPDGDYELVGDTLMLNALEDNVHTENQQTIEATIENVQEKDPGGTSPGSNVTDLKYLNKKDLSNKDCIALESDNVNNLRNSNDRNEAAQLICTAVDLDRIQANNFQTVHAEVHRTENFNEITEDNSSKQGEVAQIKIEKSTAMSQVSRTEDRDEIFKADESKKCCPDFMYSNKWCPSIMYNDTEAIELAETKQIEEKVPK